MKPNEIKKLRKKVLKILSDNKMPYEFSVDLEGYIVISVDFGDWKHDHLSLKTIMMNNGFELIGRTIVDDDDDCGDDTFSAIYLYKELKKC